MTRCLIVEDVKNEFTILNLTSDSEEAILTRGMMLQNLTEDTLGYSKHVFKCKFKDAAVKRMSIYTATDIQEEWEKLIALKNENILSYHQSVVEGSFR